jgi:hypothetical protein
MPTHDTLTAQHSGTWQNPLRPEEFLDVRYITDLEGTKDFVLCHLRLETNDEFEWLSSLAEPVFLTAPKDYRYDFPLEKVGKGDLVQVGNLRLKPISGLSIEVTILKNNVTIRPKTIFNKL